jgi:hypothetical protein
MSEGSRLARIRQCICMNQGELVKGDTLRFTGWSDDCPIHGFKRPETNAQGGTGMIRVRIQIEIPGDELSVDLTPGLINYSKPMAVSAEIELDRAVVDAKAWLKERIPPCPDCGARGARVGLCQNLRHVEVRA